MAIGRSLQHFQLLDRRSPSRRVARSKEKILAWNCWGLASSRAVRALLEVQKRERSGVLFLSETHLGKVKAGKLKRRLGCDKFIIHESDGRSGGLLMLRNKGLVVEQLNVSQYYIDVVVGEGGE